MSALEFKVLAAAPRCLNCSPNIPPATQAIETFSLPLLNHCLGHPLCSKRTASNSMCQRHQHLLWPLWFLSLLSRRHDHRDLVTQDFPDCQGCQDYHLPQGSTENVTDERITV